MPVVVLLIVLAVIVFLLYRSIQDARQQQGQRPDRTATAPRPAPATPARPAARSRPRPRLRRAKSKVDEAALAAHVVKLREAIGSGLIDMDEAIASVVRQTDGALGEDAARQLLEQDDAA